MTSVAASEPPHAVVDAPSGETVKEIEIWEPKQDKDKWSDKPTVEDQYMNPRYGGTFLVGPVTVKVFDMASKTDNQELNRLMTGMEPEGAPRVILEQVERHPFESSGNWKVFLSYRRVRYRVLVKRRVPAEEVPTLPAPAVPLESAKSPTEPKQ